MCVSPYPLPLASPSHPPYPTPLGGRKGADLPVLCSCFALAIYFTFGNVYTSVLLSHFVPAYPPSPVLKSMLYICVFIPVLPLCSSEPFFSLRFHIYVLAYGICFSLSDLLHSVGQTLGPSTSLQITQFCLFLWLSNIPLYICATSSLSIHLSMDT